jgi:hypothetical protein
MPPAFVKKTGQLIHYYYAKLVIGPSAGLAGSYGFIIDRYKALETDQIQMSDYNRELWLKEIGPHDVCAYCGGPGPLVADHVIPLASAGPDSMHNILRVCPDCNATKSDRDLIERWDTVHSPRLGPASESLPRLAGGIYLKLAYDWHRVQNTLELPARSLEDLRPFQSSRRPPKERAANHPGAVAVRSRATRPSEARPDRSASQRARATQPPDRSQTLGGALGLLLGSYLYKEDLQELLLGLELPTTGAKEELIRRLGTESGFDPKDALPFLDREELESLCEDLGLPNTGFLRGTLEDRVIAAILTERRTARV